MHGNNNNKMFLAREFLAFWSKKTEEETKVEEEGPATPSGKAGLVSKKKVVDKIQEVAEYKRPGEGGSKCWLVKEEILTVHGVAGAPAWEYTLEQPNKNSHGEEPGGSRPESPACRTPGTPTAPANLITKFARVLTEQEKEEAKAKQEKEAQLAKARKEEQAAELALPGRHAHPLTGGEHTRALPKTLRRSTCNKRSYCKLYIISCQNTRV